MDLFSHPYFGGLFADDDMAALLSGEAQLQHMLAFEAAFSRAMGAAGRFDPALAKQAAAHIAAFQPDLADLTVGCARDGLPLPALVAQLKAGAGDTAKAIHLGATSQDVMDTAIALTLKSVTDLLIARLTQLEKAMRGLLDQYGDNALMGRTRMQAALPMTVADRVSEWKTGLAHTQSMLHARRPLVERLSLSGPIGTADFADVAVMMADELGLHAAPATWHSTRGPVVDYAMVFAQVTGSLGKFGQDIALMAQQGIDEVRLSGGGTSSAMAHKSNPILAELLVTLARYNATQAGAMQQTMVHEQERSGAAWALEWMVLPQMAQTAGRATTAAQELVAQITWLGTPDRT